MYTWFLCILVIALSCSNVNAAHDVVYRQVLDTIRNVTLNDTCKCQAARNEYTYKYPEVARYNNDPVYHFQKLANDSYVWNCSLCANQPIYHNTPKCQCVEARERYVLDYRDAGYTGGADGAYGFYESTGILFGHTWHCELCILPLNLTCIEARLEYYLRHGDEIQKMDEVFHYITYGYREGKLWPIQFCPRDVISGNDLTLYVCPRSVYLYSLFYNGDTWGMTAADHFRKYHLTIGRPWYYYSCSQASNPIAAYNVPPECQCVLASAQYYSNYADILPLGVNANFHYKYIAYKEPYRKWDCDLCNTAKYPGSSITSNLDVSCRCASATNLFIETYKSMLTSLDGDAAWSAYISGAEEIGLTWHCEMCPNVTRESLLKLEPRHLLKDATCIAARNAYMIKYPEVVTNKQDPVWHFENYGYNQSYFWDQGLCQSASEPKYLTDFACSSCDAAKQNYSMTYPSASYFNNPWEHWRIFYLRQIKSGQGYVYPCEGLCNLDVLPTTQATTTGGTTTTTGGTTSTGSTTGGTTSTGTPTLVPTSTIGNPNTGASSQSDGMNRSSSDNNDDGGLEMGPLLAIVVPLAAVLSVGIGMLFIHQQRRQAVQALVKAEEGERRNYKIDFMSLSIDWLIGSGSFGHVYRGEYRGADVAIKKLKKQNMGNQQLEDLAKEAMVMVGLRHPNIVLFMGVCLERPELCIVTEYMPRGNLYDVLHDSAIKLPFSVVKNMALHIVKGLQFIHSAGMIHRDLKSPNLLVDANWTIKIADFGLSCAKSQITDDAQISLLWTSPEILMREKNCYSEKSDVYSLGIILWELMSRQTPFNEFTAAAIPPVIVLGKRPPVNSDWNPTLKVLMAQCWGQLPSHRPSVREVRATLDSIQHDSSLSEAGANTPASVHSSISSDMGSEVSVFPPRGHITVAFIDVDNSGKLWEADPSTMLVALRLLNDTNRKMLIEYGGYEAKTEGDASMLTFADPVNAVNYCIATQLALLEVDWPPSLIKHPAAREEWSEQGILLYRGLRVRMGLHIGVPHCEQDQITFRTEYFGPIVNTAARIVSQAVGGQIVASTDVYKLIANNLTKLESCAIEQSGSIVAKNSESMSLYKIWPKELKERDTHPIVDLTNNNSLTNSPHYSSDNYGYSQDSMDSNDSYEEDRYAWNLRHNEKWIINYDDLDLDVVIGTGSFGDVFSGTMNGNKVAIKQFMKQKVTDEILLEMRTESGILSAIEHPNIIKFIGMCIKIPHLCLVTELLERGSLAAILLGSEPLSWEQRKNFALDIAKGLQYLHSNNIIHRDVKSPNMLVAADWTIKIGDFGFSRVKSESHTMTQCGTVAWTAPEIFLGERYSEKADVYSYAVILWELVFRKKPWQGMNSMKVCHSVENGERLSTANPPTGTPEFMIKLMDACWLQDHEARPSFTEVIKFIEQQQR